MAVLTRISPTADIVSGGMVEVPLPHGPLRLTGTCWISPFRTGSWKPGSVSSPDGCSGRTRAGGR